ncbi:MAG: glycosyltransferase family 39 protein [Candidatus Omnitrophota bacterium]
MSFIFSLLSLGVIGIFFILLGIRRARYEYSVMELVSLSFFVGIGFACYQLFLYYLLGIDYSLGHIVIVPLVLFIMVFSRYIAKPQKLKDFMPVDNAGGRWGMTERLLVAALIVQVLWTVFLVVPTPVHSHDAVANYALKAKIFYFAAGVPDGFFAWGEAAVAHPDYPLLLPFLMTWIYVFTGFNDLIVNMIMPVIYLAFLILFYSQMKKSFSRQYSLILVFILATIPQLADYATIIHTDLILTALVTCAFVYFLLYVRTGNRMPLVLSVLLFGFSLWTKNEAIVFAGAFVAVLFACIARAEPARRKRALVDAAISLLIVTVIAAPWFAVRFSNTAVNSDIDFSRLTPERLWQNVKDIPVLLDLFQQEIFGPKKWNIFWVLVFAGIIWKRKMLGKGECFYAALFLALSVAGYFAGYMCTTGYNLYFYVNTTISRFMLHFCGIALVFLAYLFKDDYREISGSTPR